LHRLTYFPIVALVCQCDRDLRRRIRKVPGVPLMYIVSRRYQVERLPDGGVRLFHLDSLPRVQRD
jgi:hypothetical protein